MPAAAPMSTRPPAITYATDQAFTPGGFGYIGRDDRVDRPGIAGTDRDALYQDLRTGMSDYRFAVPNGTYRVDLSFAELQFDAPASGSSASRSRTLR